MMRKRRLIPRWPDKLGSSRGQSPTISLVSEVVSTTISVHKLNRGNSLAQPLAQSVGLTGRNSGFLKDPSARHDLLAISFSDRRATAGTTIRRSCRNNMSEKSARSGERRIYGNSDFKRNGISKCKVRKIFISENRKSEMGGILSVLMAIER